MLVPFTFSELLGFTSIACWLGAQFPQVLENIRRQSCEGLALPFLANWLLGDISNLVGCILTHQLPFQTYLAIYFVFVDCALVAQYFYYYKRPKVASPAFGHIRGATTPAIARRMSVDRGASRYRTLSAVAASVAQAAALAAQQDENTEHRDSRGRHQHISGHPGEASTSRVTSEDDDVDESALAALSDSFHSEGGRDIGRKRVSWSIERNGNRGASVGRHSGISRSSRPAPLYLDESFIREVNPHSRDRSLQRDGESLSDVEEPSPPNNSRRESRASRRGATMVFLGAWALFSVGAMAGNKRSLPSNSITNIGRVLSPRNYQIPEARAPIVDSTAMSLHLPTPHYDTPDFKEYHESILEDGPPHENHPDEPSAERITGRIFAWLCTTLYLTSRLPQIWKNFVRKSVEGLSMYLFIFAFLGNSFYVSSIIFSPKAYLPPPESTEFLRESIPYLLGSGGTLLFDITIVTQSFIYRPRPRKQSTHSRIFEEEAGLLAGDTLSAHPPIASGEAAITSRGRTSHPTRSSIS